MNSKTGKILLQKKGGERGSALGISCKSGRFIPRVITIFADRSDLDTPINDVLIQTDFTEISPEANNLALRQDVNFNLKG